MTQQQAKQVCDLLNNRNQLAVPYTEEKILRNADNYLFEAEDDEIIGCVEIKNVQWYQCEICHLFVSDRHEGKGYGKRLIMKAEEKAKTADARISQCTIRAGNLASEVAFRQSGYSEACRFFNVATRNYVAVWQKVLTPHP